MNQELVKIQKRIDKLHDMLVAARSKLASVNNELSGSTAVRQEVLDLRGKLLPLPLSILRGKL